MTPQTRKAIELLAEEFEARCEEHYKCDFIAGAEALDKLYSEGVEFDEAAFWAASDSYRAAHNGDKPSAELMARWQFEQMKVRVGVLETDLNAAQGMCVAWSLKCKDLEAQIAAKAGEC